METTDFRLPRQQADCTYFPRRYAIGILARISHHPPAATAQWYTLAGFRSVGVLNVLSSTPARSSVAKTSQDTPFNRLATYACENCGLVIFTAEPVISAAQSPVRIIAILTPGGDNVDQCSPPF